MKKILWLDIETSGLDPIQNGIIQIAGIIEIDGKIKKTFNFLNNCTNKKIDQGALEVNNFTIEKIIEHDLPTYNFVRLIGTFRKYIQQYNRKDKFIIAGQNIKFDIDFLIQFFKENNDKYFFSWFQGGAYLDTLYLITILQHLKKMPILENRKNETIGKFFNEDTSKCHDALEDINLTRNNYYNMIKLLKEN